MPRKKPTAEPPATRTWTAQETSHLRRAFATTTNADLATQLGRTIKSVAHRAGVLGLTKSPEHRSRQSQQTALAYAEAHPDEMAARGSAGGKIGGVARAKALTPARRKKIAKAAINARWAKAKD